MSFVSLCSTHSSCVRVISVRFCSFAALFQIVFDYLIISYLLMSFVWSACTIGLQWLFAFSALQDLKLFAYVCWGFPRSDLLTLKVVNEILLSCSFCVRGALVVSVSASHTVGCVFATRLGHTKDHHKNFSNCLPALHACVRVGVWKCSPIV